MPAHDSLAQLAAGVLDRSHVPARDSLPPGVEPEHVLIFRIWASEGASDCDRTAALASKRLGKTITPEAVSSLADGQSWRDVAAGIHQALRVATHNVVERVLSVARIDAITALHDIVRDESAAVGARVNAAKAIMDRAEFHPLIMARDDIRGVPRIVHGALADMTDEELAGAVEAYQALPDPDAVPVPELSNHQVMLGAKRAKHMLSSTPRNY